MGVDFTIEVEAKQPSSAGITEREIQQYYQAHTPSGEPALAAIRDHLLRAMAIERSTEPDPIDALHARFIDQFGRERIWFDVGLEAIALARQVTPLSRFQRAPDDLTQWCDPTDGLRTVRALQGELGSDQGRTLECLAQVEQILAIAEREGRRWRLLAFW